MALHWAGTFGNTFNDGLRAYADGRIAALQEFHKNVGDCPELDCSNPANSSLLNDQVPARIQAIRQTEESLRLLIRDKQRAGTRWFVKRIAAYMNDIYEQCVREHGM